MRHRFSAAVVAGVLAFGGAFGLAGCDSIGTGELDGNGTVRLLLTDAPFPFDLVEEARVTITSVEIVRAGGEVIILNGEEQTFNLLDLRDGVTAEIGEGVVEPGVYTHARLRVSEAAVIMNDGTVYDLKVPSGRIKILLPHFEVDEEGFSEATLDFHVEHSFVVRGLIDRADFTGFIFKPVVRTISVLTNRTSWQHEGDLEDDLSVRGAIEALSQSGLTVDGLEIEVNEATQYEGIADLSSLSIGDRVKVTYLVTDEGDLVAIKIELDDDDSDGFELKGTVTAVGDASFAVDGVNFHVTDDTEFDASLGSLAGLSIGAVVEVEYEVAEDASLRALSVSLDD